MSLAERGTLPLVPQGRIARATALAAAALTLVPATAIVLNGWPWSDAQILALEAFASAALLGLLAWAGAELSGDSVSARLGLAPGRLSWGTLLALAVGLVAVSHGLDGALRLLGVRETGALAELDRTLAGLRSGELALTLLGLGLLAPLGEELLFRGLLLRALQPRLGSLLAVLLSAVAFGALHVDPVHTSAAFVLGLYLGAVALWSGGVRAAIAVHAVNNVIAVLESALGPGPFPSPLLALLVGIGVGLPPLGLARRESVQSTRRAFSASDSRGDLQDGRGSADL